MTSGKGAKTPNPTEDASRPVGSFLSRVLDRTLDYIEDLIAILMVTFAAILTLGLLGLTQGGLVDPIVSFLGSWFGLGAFLLPLPLVLGFIALMQRRMGHFTDIPWWRVIAVEIAYMGGISLLSILEGMSLPRAEDGFGGGIVGWSIATLVGDLLGSTWTAVFFLVITLLFGAYGLQGVILFINTRFKRMREPEAVDFGPFEGDQVAVIGRPEAASSPKPSSPQRLPRQYRKHFEVKEIVEEKPARSVKRDRRLPPMDLLESGKPLKVTSREVNFAAGLIEKTLGDFGLPARVVDFRAGPSVTQFAVEPGYIEQITNGGEIKRQKVRVSQISALANDLALALSAPRLRIEAPVPGQAYVGIEVPNQRGALVHLKPVMESKAFQNISSSLTIALGWDVAGAPVAADLALMPHLLIAGTTGSGKSVCISSIASSLVINNTPEDLKLVMIDPKMVELIRFNGLPHLLGKVETELDRIIGVLRWCTQEMDRRYRLLEKAKARDIEMFNRGARRRRDQEHLPRVVVIIDELSDLMMIAPDQTEQTLVRLAQMARATGIHLVVATQRPSTDILTGLIKANFPARISFAVASGVDSRVILDSPGAETLLGKGDMLYLSPEASAPVRIQSVMVSDEEIESLVEYWQKEFEEDLLEHKTPPWEDLLERQVELEGRDEVLEQAIELVKQRGEASASLLQRSLRIGYPRAARLMDELEALGVVGRPQAGGKTREVLIDHDGSRSDNEDESSDPA